jgi:flagellar hook-associated protein 1 FlgK
LSLNGIAASALTALKSNSAALAVVSNNVANINTDGYARRVVNQQTLAPGGQLMGVDIASVQRVVDQFLQQESLSAGAASAQYGAQANFFSQLNGVLGGPGDNQSLSTRLTNLQSAFATASQAPTAAASYTGIFTALEGVAGQIANVSSTISGMQTQIDGQVANSISEVNGLIKQLFTLNIAIKNAVAGGNQDTGLADQRDVALAALAEKIDIRISRQPDGSLQVSTTDGTNLVSQTYAQLSYTGGVRNGTFGNIQIQDFNPATGQPIGVPAALDPHLTGGALKGMIDMRDQSLGGLAQALGNFARTTANAINQVANENAGYPPPASLSGRNTGLLAGDALNFTGITTIAVASANGGLVHRIDVNFGAGTISRDGVVVGATGATISSLATGLDAALGADGDASFSNGVLSLSATGGNGIVVKDDATTPASRGGAGFSHFFGLNDLFKAQSPAILATGLSAADASGLAAGGMISLSLKGPDGDIVCQVNVTTVAGMTVGGVISAINTALGGAATLTLNADGSVSTTKAPAYSGYQFNVMGDTTLRGGTGLSFTAMLGIGDNNLANQATGFAVTPAVQTAPQRIGLAKAGLTTATPLGSVILTGGDNSGALALQNILNANRNFSAAGGLSAQTASLSDYAAAFYQNLSTRSNSVSQMQATQDDRLQEAQSRMASVSGVNLDEELTNLTTYQQAYAASARVLSVVDKLYETLLQL